MTEIIQEGKNNTEERIGGNSPLVKLRYLQWKIGEVDFCI